MTLGPPDDARWFLEADATWQEKVGHGPPGFEAYVAWWPWSSPLSPSGSGDDAVTPLLEVLASWRPEPAGVTVGIWPGWGEWRGQEERGLPHVVLLEDAADTIPMRDYTLVRSALPEAFSASTLRIDRGGLVPHLAWPDDHAWFLAADVDPEWACLGGPQALLSAVHADPRLDTEVVAYGVNPEPRDDA